MRIRVRGPSGTSTITLEASSTWSELLAHIRLATKVVDFDLKYGYPPMARDEEVITDDMHLSDIPFRLDQEQITVVARENTSKMLDVSTIEKSEKILQAQSPMPRSNVLARSLLHDASTSSIRSSATDVDSMHLNPPEIAVPSLEGVLVLRIMPDDNSCLFRAISSVVLGSALDGMIELRSIVAQSIRENCNEYNETVLEKTPENYCKWIQQEYSWGGGIELSILSQHFDIEICTINVQDVRVLRFNEGRPTRCILVYSGIHYDVCAIAPYADADPELDRKIFNVVRVDGHEIDGGVLDAALELCDILRERHYFTDTSRFDVRCKICDMAGNGEKWATEHAKLTNHTTFSEA